MDQLSKAARTGVLLYRVVAVAGVALTFLLFISGTGSALPRTIVFMTWLALGVFSLIRTVSDVLSGQHQKEQSFRGTIDLWVKNTGSEQSALRYFAVMLLSSSLLKLAAPFLLWYVFR